MERFDIAVAQNRTISGIDSQELLIETWLRTKSRKTQIAYRKDISRLVDALNKPLRLISLPDLQDYSDSLADVGLAETSQQRMLASIKSLFTFAHSIGYLQFDPAKALKLPKTKDRLAERILSEEEIIRMIALEPNIRNRAFLRLLYFSGGRVSEICDLCWRDLQQRGEAGQTTLFGKGGKTRAVMIPGSLYRELLALRAEAGPDDPIIRSRKKKGRLNTSQAWRIVRAAALRVGIIGNVSPHWFRHSHASHAIDNGAPLNLIQQTLGHSSLAITGRYTHAKPTDSSGMYLKG